MKSFREFVKQYLYRGSLLFRIGLLSCSFCAFPLHVVPAWMELFTFTGGSRGDSNQWQSNANGLKLLSVSSDYYGMQGTN